MASHARDDGRDQLLADGCQTLRCRRETAGWAKTAEMDRVRYQHMIGYLTGKHSINQAEAAEIISEHSMSVTGRSPKPKTILELASGWKKNHEFSIPSKLFDVPRWQRHEEMLYELMEMTGDPDYFPEQIANYRKPE